MASHRQFLKHLLASVSAVFLILVPALALAQVQGPDANLASDLNLPGSTTDLRTTVIRVIQYLLSFLGLLAVAIILYGGFVWMTANGSADRIERAKKILINGVIGLVIILSAWLIVALIVRTITEDIPGGEGGDCDNDGICEMGESRNSCPNDCGSTDGCVGNNCPTSFRITGFSPADGLQNPPGAPRNTVVKIYFSKDINQATITNTSVQVKQGGVAVAGTISFSGNRTVLFTPSTPCPAPNEDRFCFTGNTQFTTEVDSGAVKSSVDQTLSGITTATWWTNDLVDTSSPTVSILAPGGTVPADSSVLFSARVRDDGLIAQACLYGEEENNSSNLADLTEPQCDSGIAAAESQDHTIVRSWDTTGQLGKYFTLKATGEDSDTNPITEVTKRVKVVAQHCGNNKKDADETDIDCGGADCGGCDGASCDADTTVAACQADDTLCGGARVCSPGSCTCVSRPLISDVQLPDGAVGNYITISGSGFGNNPGRVIFLGTDGRVGTPDDRLASLPNPPGLCAGADYWTPIQVIVEVPAGATSGPLYIEQAAAEGGLNDDTTNNTAGLIMSFTVNNSVRPSLACLNPISGCYVPGTPTPVSFYGKNFDSATAAQFGNRDGLNFAKVSGNEVKVDLPDLRPATVSTRVVAGSVFSNPVNFGATSCMPDPRIDRLDPTSGPIKQTVTITGANFGTTPGKVFFKNGATEKVASTDFPDQCTSLSLWQNTQVIVRVPDGLAVGSWDVRVQRLSDQIFSNAAPFTVNNGTPTPLLCRLTPTLGPVGTAVRFIGEGFSTPQGTGNAYFYQDKPATSITNWSDAAVSGAVVPNTATSGDVYIKNSSNQNSNKLSFVVGSCRANSDCQSGEICCSDGTCRLDGECPAAGAYALRSYRWRFIAGDPAPRVIERQQCDLDLQSPSPFKNTTDACPNLGRISVSFSLPTDVQLSDATCNDIAAVTLEECEDQACAGVTDTIITLSKPDTVDDRPLCVENAWQAELTQNLAPGKWYRGTVHAARVKTGKTASSPDGVNMKRDYVWKFATRESNCEVQKVMCSVDPRIIPSIHGDPAEAEPRLNQAKLKPAIVSANCNLLNCSGRTTAWNSPSAFFELKYPQTANCGINYTTAKAEGEAEITATDTGSSQVGICKVTARIPNLRLVQNWPACEAACRNAEIGARFNSSLDPATIAGKVSIEKCADITCDSTTTVAGIAVNLVDSGSRIPNDEISITPGTLDANTYYLVKLKSGSGGILSVDGKTISNETDAVGHFYTWQFRTTDKICTVDRLVTSPDFFQVRAIGATGDYDTQPYSEPDSCSATGQPLQPYSIGYNWSSSNVGVATVTNDNNFDIPPTAGEPVVALVDPYQKATSVGTDRQCSITPFECRANIVAEATRSDGDTVSDGGIFSLQCGFKRPGICASTKAVAVSQVKGRCANDPAKVCLNNTDCGSTTEECRKPDANCDGQISGLDFLAYQAKEGSPTIDCPGLDANFDNAINDDDLNLLSGVYNDVWQSFPKNACSNGVNGGVQNFAALGRIQTSNPNRAAVSTNDGKYILTTHAATDGEVSVVEVAKRQEIKVINLASAEPATGIVLSPDGKKAAVIQSGHIALIDIGSLAQDGAPATLSGVTDLAFSADGQTLFATVPSGNKVVVIKVADRTVEKEITGFSAPTLLALDKTKDIVYVVNATTSSLKQINVASRSIVQVKDPTDETGQRMIDKVITFTGNPKDIVAGTNRLYLRTIASPAIHVFDPAGQKFESSFATTVGGDYLSVDQAGKYLAANVGNDVAIFDTATLNNVSSPTAPTAIGPLVFAGVGDIYGAPLAAGNNTLIVFSPVGSCESNADCNEAAGSLAQCGNGAPVGTCSDEGDGIYRCSNDPSLLCTDSQNQPDSRFCNLGTNTAGCCGARPWVESVTGALAEDNTTCRNSAFVVRFNTLMNATSLTQSITLSRDDGNGNCSDLASNGELPWYKRLWNFIVDLFVPHNSATAQTTCPVSARVTTRVVRDVNGNPLQTEAVIYPNGLLEAGHVYTVKVLGDAENTGQTGAMSTSGIRMAEDSVTNFQGNYDETSNTHPRIGDKICAIQNIQVRIQPDLAKGQQEARPRTLFNPYDTFSCFGDNCNCEKPEQLGCRINLSGQEVAEDQDASSPNNQHNYEATATTVNGQDITAAYRWDNGGALDPQNLLDLRPDQNKVTTTLINNLGNNRTGLANVKVTAASAWTCSNNGNSCVVDSDCGGGGTCQGASELVKSQTIPVSVYLCKNPWSNKYIDGPSDTENNIIINYCRDNNGVKLPDFRAAVPLDIKSGSGIRTDVLFREPAYCSNDSDRSCTTNNDCTTTSADGSVTSTGTCSAPGIDAIRLQVVTNGRHLSPEDWYEEQGFAKGAPQSSIVDGYAAVIDGRTIYIGGGNAVSDGASGKNLYTNIYILSYTQNARPATREVWNRMIQGITFNINQLAGGQCQRQNGSDVYNVCENEPSRVCSSNSDCTDNGACVQAGCLFDNDCPKDFFCNGRKPQIARDVRRLNDIVGMSRMLEQFRYGSACRSVTIGAPGDADCNGKIEGNDILATRYFAEHSSDFAANACKGADYNLNGRVEANDVSAVIARVDQSCTRASDVTTNYPALNSGSYIQGTSTSRWPSWQESFGSEFRSQLPNDPLNMFAPCNGFSGDTCWSQQAKAYSCQANTTMCNVGTSAYPPAVPRGACSNDSSRYCSENSDCSGGICLKTNVYTYTAYGICQKEVTRACLFDADCGIAGPCLRGNDYAACGFFESCFAPAPQVVGSNLSGRRLCLLSSLNTVYSLPGGTEASCSYGDTVIPEPPAVPYYEFRVAVRGAIDDERVVSDQWGISCVDGECPGVGDEEVLIPAGSLVQLRANPKISDNRTVRFTGCDRVYHDGADVICELIIRSRFRARANFEVRGPVIDTFAADNSTISLGGTTTLRWSIANTPTSVSLRGNGLPVPNCPDGSLAAAGSCTVEPAGTTYYQLTATNRTGYDTKTIDVYVNAPPNTSNIPLAVGVTHPGNEVYLLAVPAPKECINKTVTFEIASGFSADGTPQGPSTRVTGTCQANGVMAATTTGNVGNKFRIVDYCPGGDCSNRRSGNAVDIR